MNYLTIDQIAERVDKSTRTVAKKKIQDFLAHRKMTNGRPINFYSIEVLKLFELTQHTSKDIVPTSSVAVPIKKSRGDSQAPRKPAGISLEARIKLESQVTNLSRTLYLKQSNKFNLKECVENACKMIVAKIGLSSGFDCIEDMIEYYYFKRIMRKDASYVGACYSENWKLLWEDTFDVHSINNKLPTKIWEYYELFSSENIIGAGFGAGSMWTMDGTNLDLWVNYEGKKELKKFFAISDVVTGYPLILHPIESESAEAVLQAIWRAVAKYGVPKLGIILDNSSAFRSKQVQGFINLLYSNDELLEYSNIDWIKQVFPNQGIVKYPLAKIPTFFGKAKLERAFRHVNEKFTSQESRALSRRASTEKNAINLELGTVPTKSLKLAQDYEIIFDELLTYIYNDYIEETNYKDSEFLVKKGIIPNKLNAWIYFGGDELMKNPKMPPTENAIMLLYYRTHKNNKNSIKVEKLGEFRITVKQKQLWYSSNSLTYRDVGMKITVIQNQDDNGDTAFCFLEYNPKQRDERVKNEGDVCFIGMAESVHIRSRDDFHKIGKRVKLQNAKLKEIKQAKEIDDDTKEFLEFGKELKLNEKKDYSRFEKSAEILKTQRYLETANDIISKEMIEVEPTEIIDTYSTNNQLETENENNQIDTSNLDDLFDFKF